MNLTDTPRRLSRLPALLFIGVACTALASCRSNGAREARTLNVDAKGIALEGYDPVAYFPEGGGEPAKGSKEHVLTHLGVTYRFSSEKNREAFRKDPERYEPAYGGWCAYSMAQGKQVDPSSKNFLIQGDRLHVFYKGLFANARDKWKKEGPEKLREKADANWAELTRKKGGRR
jgi:YHS domain-containing protein